MVVWMPSRSEGVCLSDRTTAGRGKKREAERNVVRETKESSVQKTRHRGKQKRRHQRLRVAGWSACAGQRGHKALWDKLEMVFEFSI